MGLARSGRREELDLLRKIFQLMATAPLETQARSGDEIAHGPGDEHLARPRGARDARPDMDRDATELCTYDLALAGVDAGADLDPLLTHGVSNGKSAGHCARGAVEGREEAVAGVVDLAAAMALEFASHCRMVALEHSTPLRVAEREGALGRADDVGVEHSREHATRV